MSRRTPFLQICAGLLLSGAGAHLVRAAEASLALHRDADPSLDVTRSPTAPAGQTLRDREPPPEVGARFDDDAALPAAARAVASYTLSARLDDVAHSLKAHGSIEWTNAASRPTAELYVHLYLNAFKNNRTVFLRSPIGGSRSGQGARSWGTIDVEKLSVREMGTDDLWPRDLPHTPDDPEDETDIRVPLPRAVEPGETITLDVAWTAQLPEIVERTGYVRDFHMVGQWFPKIARREPDGAWAHFPFHSQSEFYADYGSYDVTLDVPEGVVVGATGALVEKHEAGGRAVQRFRAGSVHDFAWTAWRGFRVQETTLGGVRVRLLYPPGNEHNAAATLSAVAHGLAHYGKAFGKYPYETLTVVHPPEFAPAASGMEYPTLITTGFPWYTSYLSPFVERVTLHELGHQWFYGLVGTDEHSWPFLDEGLTTFAESSAMGAWLGPRSGLELFGLGIDGNAYTRWLAVDAGHDDIVARPAADFVNFREIGALVYARTGTVLETLGRVYGRELLVRALGRYARRYRFEHPTPKHLIAVVREVMGDDPAETLSSALFEGGWVDFVARDLQTTEARAPAGIFQRETGRQTVEPAPRSSAAKRWAGRVVVYRHGSLRFPVDVDLHFADGTSRRRHWDGRGRFQSFECEESSPLVAAVVDPESRVLLDENLWNNGAGRMTSTSPRLLERGLYFAELLMGALGP